ncbi:MAG: hypothetical protein KKF44_05105, partial [Nanoarchaeota archaeon]|nr:hypothetical protein [Nanoarchaeota archaeon]
MINKKTTVMLLCFGAILLNLYVATASEIAYSDWIYNNQTLELSNAKYTFLLGSKGQSLLIKFDAELKTLN